MFGRSIFKSITLHFEVLKLLFDFKFLCNWGLFCDSVNILKFSCSAPRKQCQENIPQGIPLLSEVKFYFWEISHLPNVSTCIKNENLKISQNNLVFCQLDLLFGKGLTEFILQCTQCTQCLSTVCTRLIIIDPVSYLQGNLRFMHPMTLPQSLELLLTCSLNILTPLWTLYECSFEHFTLLKWKADVTAQNFSHKSSTL